MEDKFWPFEQVEIPNCYNAVWIVRGGRILVVRCDNELRKLAVSSLKCPKE